MEYKSHANGDRVQVVDVVDGAAPGLRPTATEESRTPRASHDGSRMDQNGFEGQQDHDVMITAGRRHTVAGNGATLSPDEIAPSDLGALHDLSTFAASTTAARRSSIAPSVSTTVERGYASSIATEATETPLMHRRSEPTASFDRYNAIRRLYGPAPVVNKTKGRKVYVAACNVVDVVMPLDMNREAESMRDSSIYKMGKAVRRGIARRA